MSLVCEWTAKRARLWSGAVAADAARFLARLQVSPRRCQPVLWGGFKSRAVKKVVELVYLFEFIISIIYFILSRLGFDLFSLYLS